MKMLGAVGKFAGRSVREDGVICDKGCMGLAVIHNQGENADNPTGVATTATTGSSCVQVAAVFAQ
jgi:hypothetical protein